MIDQAMFAKACSAAGFHGYIRPICEPDRVTVELHKPSADLVFVQHIDTSDVLVWGSAELAIAAAVWRAARGVGPQFSAV